MDKRGVTERFLEAYDELVNTGKVKGLKDFSTNIGISNAMITEMRKGRSNVGVQAIQNIVLYYRVSPYYLLLGEGSMYRNGPETADHIPDAGKMISTGKDDADEQPDNGLTAFLQQENARLHTRITQLERQNAVLEYRLEHSGEDK